MSLFAHRLGTFEDALGPSVHATPYTIHHWYRDVRRKPSEVGAPEFASPAEDRACRGREL
jgi:hypothetical protein